MWCKIVIVDGKRVLFTESQDANSLASMTVNSTDFLPESKEGLTTISLKLQRREFEFKYFATEENARKIINTNIVPLLKHAAGEDCGVTELSDQPTVYDPKSTYYDAGGVTVLDVIKAKLSDEQYKGFLLGNVIKYSGRLNFKGSPERDAEKTAFYSKLLKEVMSDEKNTKEP